MSDVFLSHDWGALLDGTEKKHQNHERVKLVNQILRDLQIVTWFDEEQLNGNIRDMIPHGLENSQCMIVFITRNYHEKVNSMNPKDNCYYELNFGVHVLTNKRMIPVVMEEEMKDQKNWRGRLAAELGQNLYIDLVDAFVKYEEDAKDISLLKEQCERIVDELNRIKIQFPLQPGVSARIMAPNYTHNSPEWTKPSNTWIQNIFGDPLSYSVSLLLDELKKLQIKLIADPELNKEFRTINFHDFFVNITGIPDEKPIRSVLDLLLSVNNEVLSQILKALLSIVNYYSQESRESPIHEEQTRLLDFISDCDGVKVFAQLFSKYFKKENSLEIVCQLLRIFRVLKSSQQKNLIFLQSIKFYQNVVPAFQSHYKLSLKDLGEHFEIEHLKSRYSVAELQTAGFSWSILMKEFTLKDFYQSKIPLKNLKGLFPMKELKQFFPSANYFIDLKFPLAEIVSSFGQSHFLTYKKEDLLRIGYCYEELRDFFSIKELSRIGFDLKDFQRACETLDELRTVFSLPVLHKSGYSVQELKTTFSLKEFIDSGAPMKVLKSGFTIEQLCRHCSPKRLFDDGFSLEEILSLMNYNNNEPYFCIADCVESGITVADFKNAGIPLWRFGTSFSPTVLVDIGYRLRSVVNIFEISKCCLSGITVNEFKESGFTVSELAGAFRLVDLFDAGYSIDSIVSVVKESSSSRKSMSYCLTLFSHYPRLEASDLKHFRAAGVPAASLQPVSYVKDLYSAGYSLIELKTCFPTNHFNRASFTIEELMNAGFTPNELFSSRFPLKSIVEKTSIKDCKASGISAKDFSSYYGIRELYKDFTPRELFGVGISLKLLWQETISSDNPSLRCFGWTDFSNSGFTAKDFRDNGLVVSLYSKKIPLAECLAGGHTVKKLVDFYPIANFKEAGFLPTDLKGTKFTIQDLQEHYSLNKLRLAYTDAELKAGGYSPNTIAESTRWYAGSGRSTEYIPPVVVSQGDRNPFARRL
jgi:hypothetical protein